jgi:hypothetical protein
MKLIVEESEKQRIRSLYEQSASTNYILNQKNIGLLDSTSKNLINQQLYNSDEVKKKLQDEFNQNLPADVLSFLTSKGIEPYINVRGNESLGEKVVRTGIYFNLGNSPFGINLNLGDDPTQVLGRLDDTRIGLRIPF